MQVNTETFGDVLVVHTPEDLTEETTKLFHEAIETHLETGLRRVVLQMDRSETLDSAGLTALVDLHEKLRGDGGNVKICALTETGRRIFRVTRLDEEFDLFDSMIDAVGSFQQ
jgi:anti-anti-sigma factor